MSTPDRLAILRGRIAAIEELQAMLREILRGLKIDEARLVAQAERERSKTCKSN